MRVACSEKLASFCGPEAVGALPEEPDESDMGELPEAPPLDDPGAFEAWRDALIELTLERGRKEGLKEGEARSKANAILDVLRRRGIAVSDADAQRVLACRDESALALYWERAFSTTSAAELLGD